MSFWMLRNERRGRYDGGDTMGGWPSDEWCCRSGASIGVSGVGSE